MNSKQIDMIREDCSLVFSNPEKFELLKNESILITGGTGFMGSWLCESISYLNDVHNYRTKITVVARDTDKFYEEKPHLAKRDDISLINKDVLDIIEIPNNISFVIHAAGTPDNRVHLSYPLEVINTIAKGTMRVLDACTRLPNLKKVINISSGLVYGAQPSEIERISEDFISGPDSAKSTSAYAEAKRMGETISSVYMGQFRIPLINLRPFAFIGPYQLIDKPWAINNFINDAINGGPIKILGNEKTIRSYMYPSDMAYWILTVLCHGSSGLILNIGSSESYSLWEVANIINNSISNETLTITSTLNRKTNNSIFVPDVEKAKNEFGLVLTVSLKKAINRTCRWLTIR
ncbi:MAG: NAD-dependent epimerase/dehydratase family protein [Desulfobacterales bacterium]|nr:NAD-dependent epimerase/dehydratase family protein [Desulfobacterales bacterium]